LFPRSIATVPLAGTLPEKLEAAASVGFDGVELFDNDLLTALRPKCGGSAASSIWRSQSFSRSRDFEAMPEPQRARNLERAESKFGVMPSTKTISR
jgi:4-hydroxyphenylpyruvate dioxygenase